MLSEDRTWKKIKHELVGAKLKLVRREIVRRAELMMAHKDTVPLLPDPSDDEMLRERMMRGIRNHILSIAASQTESWVAKVYNIYEDTWRRQGRRETPEFVRAVFQRAIAHQIDSGFELSNKLLQLAKQKEKNSHLQEAAMFSIQEWRKLSRPLKKKWEEQIRIRTLELGASRCGRRKMAVGAGQRRSVKKKLLPGIRRARTVAQLIKELNTLKPQMYGEHNYKKLGERYPRFLTFRLAARRDDLREKVANLQGHREHIWLAQELAAQYWGKTPSTIQTDWKKRKPPKFRKQPS